MRSDRCRLTEGRGKGQGGEGVHQLSYIPPVAVRVLLQIKALDDQGKENITDTLCRLFLLFWVLWVR